MKNIAAATISVDGIPIHEVISILRNQFDSLKRFTNEQASYISKMKLQADDDRAKVEKMEEKIKVLEDTVHDLKRQNESLVESAAQAKQSLERHDEYINELRRRPYDPDLPHKVTQVELKLASFYGPTTNILGRVAYLEDASHEQKTLVDKIHTDYDTFLLRDEDTRRDVKKFQHFMDHEYREQQEMLQQRKAEKSDIERITTDLLRRHNSNEDAVDKNAIHALEKRLSAALDDVRRDTSYNNDKLTDKINSCNSRIESIDSRLKDLSSRPVSQGIDVTPQLAALEMKVATLAASVNTPQRAVSMPTDDSQTRNRLNALEDDISRQKNALISLENDVARVLRKPDTTSQELAALQNALLELKATTAHAVPRITKRDVEEWIVEYLRQHKEDKDGEAKGLKELQRRLYLLGSECRDALDEQQDILDKKIAAIAKWLAKNTGEQVVVHSGPQTGIGTTRCLACSNGYTRVSSDTTPTSPQPSGSKPKSFKAKLATLRAALAKAEEHNSEAEEEPKLSMRDSLRQEVTDARGEDAIDDEIREYVQMSRRSNDFPRRSPLRKDR